MIDRSLLSADVLFFPTIYFILFHLLYLLYLIWICWGSYTYMSSLTLPFGLICGRELRDLMRTWVQVVTHLSPVCEKHVNNRSYLRFFYDRVRFESCHKVYAHLYIVFRSWFSFVSWVDFLLSPFGVWSSFRIIHFTNIFF